MARTKSVENLTLADHLRSISSKGGSARAEKMTPEERSASASAAGKVGGAKRAKSLTAAQRKKIASAAAKARWAKRAKPKKSQNEKANKTTRVARIPGSARVYCRWYGIRSH